MRHQSAQIGRIGLENADAKTLIAALADFDSLYRSLIKTFQRSKPPTLHVMGAWADEEKGRFTVTS